MKPYLILIAAQLFLKSNFAFSQWQLANSATTNNIVDISFPTDSIGFAVTDNGIVLKTIDEGNNWNVIATLNGTFTSICNVGLDTIFVGGNKIYRSDNGGNSWNNIANPGYTISDMEFFNSQRGVYIKPETYTCTSSQGTVTLDNYKAYESVDSGSSWQIAFPGLLPTSRFQLINDSTAYVAGGYYSIFDHCNGIYVNTGAKTMDRGISWTNAPPPGISYCNFSFINDSSGYLMSPNYATGISLWRMEDSVTTFVRSMPFGSSQIVSINKIDGYILSGNNIYVTNTEGLVWNLDALPGSFTLTKLWKDHNKEMFAIGHNGIILKKQIIESLYSDSVYAMTANQTYLQFDTVIVGGVKTKQITIHNDGSVPLSINVGSTDTFQVSTSNNIYSSSITFTLAAQRDSVINVRFIPGDTLLYQDTLVISSDSVSNIYIPVSGVGTNNLIGQLSDSLYVCRDTINVVGNFTINDGGKLVICPGTVVFFFWFFIDVSGTLVADGLPNDSIWFTPENINIGWGGISFGTTTNSDTSIMRYCVLNYKSNSFYFAIECSGRTNILIDHCSIYKSRGGINCQYSSITISNNKIFDNNNSTPGSGIKCFYDGSLIINNEIFNNKGSAGAGIWALNHDPPYPRIIQNLIFNNTANGGAGGIVLDYGTPYLINNTICNNNGGSFGDVYCWYLDSSTVISNNIIYNNSGNQLYVYPSTGVTVSNCDIQGGYAGGIGIVNQDPVFVNPTDSIGVMYQIGNYDWSLQQSSPCINAGDTALSNLIPSSDIQGNPRVYQNRIDIGAYEYQSLISVNEIANNFSILLYPNPVSDALNIFVMNNHESLEFILYDLLSRKMLQQKFIQKALINTKEFANGIYIYEVRNKNQTIAQGKVIKQ
jgi:hypothetical protein